ncbi:hypothetical protein ACHAXT_009036 [Thalassiosira profunda]
MSPYRPLPILAAIVGTARCASAFTTNVPHARLASVGPSPLAMASDNPSPDDTLHSGHVKFFDRTHGWGFITPDDSPGERAHDVFAHQSFIHMDGFRFLKSKQPVQYRVGTKDDGQIYATEIYVDAEAAAVADRLVETTMEASDLDEEAAVLEEIAHQLQEEGVEKAADAPKTPSTNNIEETTMEAADLDEEVAVLEDIAHQLQEEGEVAAVAPSEKPAPLDPFAGIKSMFGF